MRKLARTISGVAPLAVMAKPAKCPGNCVFCPTFEAMPQSYTPDSPAVLRAISCDYNAGRQVALRLKILNDMGHLTDKIELIIMGGTFLACPVEYQYGFVKACYDALNGVESASLVEAKTINETTTHRCVGLCVETRPDWCGEAEIERILEFGATRVELGVQTLDDDIFKLVRRGHLTADVVAATTRLKECGLKVHYHWMPGLPGSTLEKDLALSAKLFSDSRFRPDGLKIYPTMVVEGTELEKWYQDGRYQPYDNKAMTDLIVDIKSVVPPYVRISRVLRDIPARYIVGGLKDSLRSPLKKLMKERGIECQCIRCREHGHRQAEGRAIGKPQLVRLDYEASGGREIFLSFEDENKTLFGSLRLRIQDNWPKALKGNKGRPAAIIRELHIYGRQVSLGKREDEAAQHKGLGGKLLAEAERIAGAEFGAVEIAVLSGIGAREYYRTEGGYQLSNGYMVKKIG